MVYVFHYSTIIPWYFGKSVSRLTDESARWDPGPCLTCAHRALGEANCAFLLKRLFQERLRANCLFHGQLDCTLPWLVFALQLPLAAGPALYKLVGPGDLHLERNNRIIFDLLLRTLSACRIILSVKRQIWRNEKWSIQPPLLRMTKGLWWRSTCNTNLI